MYEIPLVNAQTSVSTVVAIRDANALMIQISTPRTGQPSLDTINTGRTNGDFIDVSDDSQPCRSGE